jgi:hypothetical protein
MRRNAFMPALSPGRLRATIYRCVPAQGYVALVMQLSQTDAFLVEQTGVMGKVDSGVNKHEPSGRDIVRLIGKSNRMGRRQA